MHSYKTKLFFLRIFQVGALEYSFLQKFSFFRKAGEITIVFFFAAGIFSSTNAQEVAADSIWPTAHGSWYSFTSVVWDGACPHPNHPTPTRTFPTIALLATALVEATNSSVTCQTGYPNFYSTMSVYSVDEGRSFRLAQHCNGSPDCPIDSVTDEIKVYPQQLYLVDPDPNYIAPTCINGPPSAICQAASDGCAQGLSALGCNQTVNLKNLGPPDAPNACLSNPSAGNPVDIATGNKYQVESDYSSSTSLFIFERFYNSGAAATKAKMGPNWRHTYERSISLFEKNNQVTAEVFRHDGKILYFTYSSGIFSSTGDRNDKLVALLDSSGKTIGYSYRSALTDETETYDLAGKLKAVKTRSNITLQLAYDGFGRLASVTDTFGRRFTFSGSEHLESMTDSVGNVYRYGYDTNSGNLISVTYPDNRIRQYLYENTSFPHALTGIIDENGARYATWSYDADGRAISSQHAGGAESTTLTLNAPNVVVTDALGTQRTYTVTEIQGSKKVGSSSQPGGSGCAASSSSLVYDSNGNIASQTDFNGNTTVYFYDTARNLETKRVENSGTAQAITTTIEWHPQFRLPVRIAEPKKLIVSSYDANGNLLSKSEQETNDANGAQGFSATLVGTARSWTFAYNQYGQVLTAKDPRTDVDGTTSYAYDAQGNLTSVTNALGKITSFDNFDANGKPGRSVDPNGLITTFTYSSRGWITSKIVGAENTRYEYDGAGQITKIEQPDGSSQSYGYDDAHRLTSITDNLGNQIVFTLDAKGNRIREQVKDFNGALVRQINRTYDPLNRLQQITGAAQ